MANSLSCSLLWSLHKNGLAYHLIVRLVFMMNNYLFECLFRIVHKNSCHNRSLHLLNNRTPRTSTRRCLSSWLLWRIRFSYRMAWVPPQLEVHTAKTKNSSKILKKKERLTHRQSGIQKQRWLSLSSAHNQVYKQKSFVSVWRPNRLART
jgi:hypothetical protein